MPTPRQQQFVREADMPRLRAERNEIIHDIREAMKDGFFTPFLGAGASSRRSSSGPPGRDWLAAASQLRLLLDKLSPEQARYVTTLAKANGIEPASKDDPIVPSQHGRALL